MPLGADPTLAEGSGRAKYQVWCHGCTAVGAPKASMAGPVMTRPKRIESDRTEMSHTVSLFLWNFFFSVWLL